LNKKNILLFLIFFFVSTTKCTLWGTLKQINFRTTQNQLYSFFIKIINTFFCNFIWNPSVSYIWNPSLSFINNLFIKNIEENRKKELEKRTLKNLT
jgi:hypothetical protein